jgi:hypothetical protein
MLVCLTSHLHCCFAPDTRRRFPRSFLQRVTCADQEVRKAGVGLQLNISLLLRARAHTKDDSLPHVEILLAGVQSIRVTSYSGD